MQAYYEARAAEYDDGIFGKTIASDGDRAQWLEEALRLAGVLASLPPARTLDVACGTGFLTKFLHGEVVGLDGSEAMLRLAAERVPNACFVRGDAFALPFADRAFERVVLGHFYGLVEDERRLSLLAEVRRVGYEVVVIDSVGEKGARETGWQDRSLKDGSRWRLYKRYFEARDLAEELGGDVLFEGRWVAVVRAPSRGHRL
ncbi:MAG TPA: class I SAM-dependent methyltransferase [Polyangiaceae bacterium]|jgi:ubiquinone/menaquinone biosynthesis C-methylase UbiE|nr:class I SAM-dependent methyltransferase [Polyangiaceae bacterium]